MAKPIINDRKLLRMVDQGKTQVQAAEFFGVSKQAIHKRLKELRGKTTRIVATKKLQATIEHKFDAIEQLININKKTLELLDQAEANPEFALRCIGEVRNQLKLASDIYGQMYSVQVVNDFMTTVTDILKEVDQDVFKEFQRRFNNERSLQSAIRIA